MRQHFLSGLRFEPITFSAIALHCEVERRRQFGYLKNPILLISTCIYLYYTAQFYSCTPKPLIRTGNHFIQPPHLQTFFFLILLFQSGLVFEPLTFGAIAIDIEILLKLTKKVFLMFLNFSQGHQQNLPQTLMVRCQKPFSVKMVRVTLIHYL